MTLRSIPDCFLLNTSKSWHESSPPGELPAGSLDVPTCRTCCDDPSSGQRQLDFVFASESIADSLTVRALNGEDEWGPSDHCRVLMEMDET